ncbi:MAG: YciI family protein [Proteobacteria bacterium]|nr:YciI family protein [Pseudomonadota bacterium]
MRYSLLIYEPDSDFARRTDPEAKAAYLAGWPPYLHALKDAGVLIASVGLMGPETATTVRLRDGRRLVQDGPFAEAKEQLGGLCVIEVPDLDAALEWAARCPAAPTGTVEVRPALPPVP